MLCVEMVFHGFGATDKTVQSIDYPEGCHVLKSLCITNKNVILGHDNGITKLDLSTQQYSDVMKNNSEHLTEVQCVAFLEESNRIVLTDVGSR